MFFNLYISRFQTDIHLNILHLTIAIDLLSNFPRFQAIPLDNYEVDVKQLFFLIISILHYVVFQNIVLMVYRTFNSLQQNVIFQLLGLLLDHFFFLLIFFLKQVIFYLCLHFIDIDFNFIKNVYSIDLLRLIKVC